ncbi:MAG: CBS domain-containing protein [Longimicrobiales bacterium]
MLAVRDIMRTDVVTVRADDTARALARVLADSEISGAPVLDGHGKVVGVASATDLVRLAAEDAEMNLSAVNLRAETDRGPDLDEEDLDDLAEADPYGFFLPEDSPLQGAELLERFPETSFDSATVADVMTPVSFAVNPDMPVPELCAFLVRGRIHRALVVSNDELVGIVTSRDVLKGVADGDITL